MKRVLLIHPEGNSFNNPTLKCVIDLLLTHGVSIDIRYRRNCIRMPKLYGVSLLPFGVIIGKYKSLILNKLFSKNLLKICIWLENIFFYGKYDLIIAVDREGLIEANVLHEITGTNYVFFSFEIMYESETSTAFKGMERDASKSVRYWFVQDEERATQLQNENKLDYLKKILIPLASSGNNEIVVNRLRDRLGIPLEKKVAISMGSISSWSMTNAIIQSVVKWPDDWVLIIHERYGRTSYALKAIGIKIDQLPIEKVYISNDASVMVDNMGDILAGVSAGISFYNPDYKTCYTGNNLKYIGLASGKISTYLKYGIPPIMNEIGSYSDLAKQYRFGLVIEDVSEIGKLLPIIVDSSWSKNARYFYEEYLDFKRFEVEVWNKLISAC
jgi:hypothetical protein